MAKEIHTTDFEHFEVNDLETGEGTEIIQDIELIDVPEDPTKWDITDWPPVG